jgi:MFS transporter, DHA1 family, staphyloferrin A biosynthesis exporter
VAEPQVQQRPEVKPGGFSTFRSLRYPDYRLLWTGTLFSSSGQWIQQVTLSWLAYQMTGSAFLLGAINGFRALPLLFLAPFGGVAADRLDRKTLMFSTQAFLLVTSLVMGLVIATGGLEVWHLFAFTLLTGVAWAFNMPVRQSVMPSLVPKDDLMNALALNSAGFNITRIIGPTLGGILIAKLGTADNFFLQAIAYFFVTLTILKLTVPTASRSNTVSVRQNLTDGAKYVFQDPTMRTLMMLALVPVIVALPYFTIMPVFAKEVLGKGAGGFGLLMAAPGIGAVIGTLTIASLSGIQRKGPVLLGAIFCLGAMLIVFSLSRSFWLSFGLLIIIGAVQMAYLTTNQTLLQLIIPDEMRGRVMGIYMLNQGLLPAGSLFAGGMADFFGAPTAVLVMGSLTCSMAVIFALRAKSLRYV